jgi:hypothetical protein
VTGRSPLGRRNKEVVPPLVSVMRVARLVGVKGVGVPPPSLRDGCAALDTASIASQNGCGQVRQVRLLVRYGQLFREATTRRKVRFFREAIRLQI